MSETIKQWPDNICSGQIRYGRGGNYDGFYLADVQHGIPTFGSVSPTEPPTIRDQHVNVFNYPGQTEAIAAQLVQRWNSHDALVKSLEECRNALHADNPADGWMEIIARADAALDLARSKP